jgi:hypothetical protein
MSKSARRKLNISQGIKTKRKQLREKRVLQALLESLCFPKQFLRRFWRKGREDLEATEGRKQIFFNLLEPLAKLHFSSFPQRF